jgi:hypothetical protein
MDARKRLIPVLMVALISTACTLPGAASPTPFTFPTPNLTLTAIFAPTNTATPAPPTLPPPPTLTPAPATETPATTPGAPGPTATVNPAGGRPNGSPVTAGWLSAAPAIDGDLSDWSSVTSYAASNCVFGCSARTGESDLSATYYLGYDSTNLYVAVKVKDDKYVQVATGVNLYKGDDVEIQLDTNLSADFYQTVLSGDDYQIGLSDGNFSGHAPEAYRWYPRSLQGPLTSVTVKGKQLTDGYTLEARIPWSTFTATPTPGTYFGFALSVSDDDLTGVASQQSMVSSVAGRKLLNPTTWGTLVLGPTGAS